MQRNRFWLGRLGKIGASAKIFFTGEPKHLTFTNNLILCLDNNIVVATSNILVGCIYTHFSLKKYETMKFNTNLMHTSTTKFNFMKHLPHGMHMHMCHQIISSDDTKFAV